MLGLFYVPNTDLSSGHTMSPARSDFSNARPAVLYSGRSITSCFPGARQNSFNIMAHVLPLLLKVRPVPFTSLVLQTDIVPFSWSTTSCPYSSTHQHINSSLPLRVHLRPIDPRGSNRFHGHHGVFTPDDSQRRQIGCGRFVRRGYDTRRRDLSRCCKQT